MLLTLSGAQEGRGHCTSEFTRGNGLQSPVPHCGPRKGPTQLGYAGPSSPTEATSVFRPSGLPTAVHGHRTHPERNANTGGFRLCHLILIAILAHENHPFYRQGNKELEK